MGVAALFLALLAPRAIVAGVCIVHLFEWGFDDIAKECENFLGPKGYGAIQVSPVSECAVLNNRPWWERYQPFSYKVISRSGDETGFKNMCDRCRKVGVKIYVDTVFNHMAANQPSGTVGTGGSSADTNNKNFPAVPYSNENFHATCAITNYNDANNVRDCELEGLHDLDQSQEYVRGKIVDHLNNLIDLGAEGFRVDAAKHMWPADLKVIYSRLKNTQSGSRPFIYQEDVDYGGEAVHHEEYTPLGHVTEFKNGRELSRCFRGQNPIKWLSNYGTGWGMMPSDSALVFIDNHDTQRHDGSVLNYKTPRNYKMAVAFMLGWGYGTPKVMSSYYFDNTDQGPPANSDGSLIPVAFNSDGSCSNRVCEHRWTAISGMIGFANTVQGTSPSNFWNNGNNQITFCRGNKGFIAFNVENYDMNVTSQTCLPAGKYCDVASGVKNGNSCTGKTVTVNNDGTAQVSVTGGGEGFLAIHANSKL